MLFLLAFIDWLIDDRKLKYTWVNFSLIWIQTEGNKSNAWFVQTGLVYKHRAETISCCNSPSQQLFYHRWYKENNVLVAIFQVWAQTVITELNYNIHPQLLSHFYRSLRWPFTFPISHQLCIASTGSKLGIILLIYSVYILCNPLEILWGNLWIYSIRMRQGTEFRNSEQTKSEIYVNVILNILKYSKIFHFSCHKEKLRKIIWKWLLHVCSNKMKFLNFYLNKMVKTVCDTSRCWEFPASFYKLFNIHLINKLFRSLATLE